MRPGRTILLVAVLLSFVAAASANMPGSFQPLLGGAPLSCTGGTVTTSGGNTIHTFTSGSNLVCTGSGSANYLVVAGGGGSAWPP